MGGTSFAILKGSTSSSKQQIIKTGSIKVKLTENFGNIDKKITTMTDSEGLLQTETYEFNIKNIGDAPAKYDLKLINEVPSDYTGNVLDTKYMKIGLEINGEEYGPFSLEEVNNIIDSDIIYKKEMVSYVLRIWLDEEKAEELLNMEDYKSFLKIKVEAEQRVESMDEGVNTTLFSYTGDVQEYRVERDGYYYIEMAGAQGGSAKYTTEYIGGLGAKTSGYIYLEAGEKLYFYVGGEGNSVTGTTSATSVNFGWNGGSGGTFYPSNSVHGGGGGATDVRLVGGSWNNTSSLISRIMVAGGGGGASSHTHNTNYSGVGGNGGALYGGEGITKTETCYSYGLGGTQIAGGSSKLCTTDGRAYGLSDYAPGFGYGGGYPTYTANAVYAGGGSGYYGGNGGYHAPGGGGSSYISGYAGVNSVEESTTITHTDQTLHYSGKYFIGGSMIEGTNEGNGYAKISYVNTKPKRKNNKLNSVRYIKNCISYNTNNNQNHWVELQAIYNGINIAKGKTITGTTSESTTRPYSRITDGDITPSTWSNPNSSSNNQCIIVDLEQEYNLDEIAVWNYFGDQRSYYNNKMYVSSDNSNWTEAITDAVLETSNGHRINAYTDTYNGYVKDNLVLWYDGYANTGTTRNSLATTWKDISGTGNNATISGATWYDKYLSFDGTNDYANTATINYNSSKAFTFQFVGIVGPKTTTTILFESSTNSNSNNGSYYIDTMEFGDKDITLAMKYGNLKNHKMADKILESDLALYTIIFDSTREYNNYISIYKNQVKYSVKETGTTGTTNGDLSNKTLSNYALYIASRAGSSLFSKIDLNSVRIYDKALTDEEILHNYLYDEQKFNLE